MMRGERRRQSRERQAAAMNALDSDSHVKLAAVAPVLDEAIDQLAPEDRTAILLRFFERLDFKSVGEAVGGSEEAARKRVSRALEKLHAFLSHRGVTLSAAGLSAVLGAEAVTAAPVGLAGTIAGAALAGATAGGSTLPFIKLIAMTKIKAGILSIVLIAGVATPLVLQHESQEQLRGVNQSLRLQLEQAAMQTDQLSNQLHQAIAAQTISQDQLGEVLRLRGQIGALKRQLSETAKAVPPPQPTSRLPEPLDEQQQQELMKQQYIAKMTYAKSWMIAFYKFAQENGGNSPASFAEAASFLPEIAQDETLLATNQFEIVYHGALQSITNPAMIIILRENQAQQALDGGWARTYGFADGHSEVHRSDSEDFQAWESQHTAPSNITASGQ
jgi:hypothetical protein